MSENDSSKKSLPSAFNVSSRLTGSKRKSLPKSLSNAAKRRKASRGKVFSKEHLHSLVEVCVTCLDIHQKLILVSTSLIFACVCLGDQPTRTWVTFSQWPGRQVAEHCNIIPTKYIKPDRYMFKQLKISLVVCHSFKIDRVAFEQDGWGYLFKKKNGAIIGFIRSCDPGSCICLLWVQYPSLFKYRQIQDKTRLAFCWSRVIEL